MEPSCSPRSLWRTGEGGTSTVQRPRRLHRLPSHLHRSLQRTRKHHIGPLQVWPLMRKIFLPKNKNSNFLWHRWGFLDILIFFGIGFESDSILFYRNSIVHSSVPGNAISGPCQVRPPLKILLLGKNTISFFTQYRGTSLDRSIFFFFLASNLTIIFSCHIFIVDLSVPKNTWLRVG